MYENLFYCIYRICTAVSKYYVGEFIPHWMVNTAQECKRITTIAALLVEKKDKMRIAVFCTGAKHKTECSYYIKSDSIDGNLGLCDGHAESVCYHMASFYLMSEMSKLHQGRVSIFTATSEGYVLKPNVFFHLFISHPPCGFMAEKECHLLSWKRPFKGKPHSLQCSSQILIGAYLGIQGCLSHLLVNPIYISSITIPRYTTVSTLHGTCVKDRLQEFRCRFPDMSPQKSEYHFHIPHVEIVDVNLLDLFPECFRPYITEISSNLSIGNNPPQQQTTTVTKRSAKGAKKMAITIPDEIIGYNGVIPMIFDPKEGIVHEEFQNVLQLKNKLVRLPAELTQKRLKSLQDAQIRLSHALNVSKALEALKETIIRTMEEKFTKRCKTVEDITSCLLEMKEHKTEVEDLKAQICKLRDLMLMDMQGYLHSIKNSLTDNMNSQMMLNDLESLLEKEKTYGFNPEFYLDLLGCNWLHYMETMHADII